MIFLDKVYNQEDLTKEYRRLARMYHPDKGGDELLMKQLNREYEIRKRGMLRGSAHNFDNLKEGDVVFVNGTECKVTHVSPYAFIAKAKYKNKSAVFDRKTGVAVGDRKYRATLI